MEKIGCHQLSAFLALLLFYAISSVGGSSTSEASVVNETAINGTGLRVGFYDSSCPAAESTVFEVVQKAFKKNRSVAPGLVRLQFHDCFIRGCDGSVLIDSTPSNRAEKDGEMNRNSLQGFRVIKRAKKAVEAICPNTVSCADIVQFASRDSAYLTSPVGYPLTWAVPSGRRDGTISKASDTVGNLPHGTDDVDQLTQRFAEKGLSQEDMVILSGAHTIGKLHCSALISRLYNFNNTHQTDPSLDPSFAKRLKASCPYGDPRNKTVPMDITHFIMDNQYYHGIVENRGLLTSDATLITNPKTKKLVFEFLEIRGWQEKFATAMVRMGMIQVLTGQEGQIRVKCNAVNK